MRHLLVILALYGFAAHADVNVKHGPGALELINTGVSNVAAGQDALHDQLTGYDNSCVGAHACYYGTDMDYVSGFGAGALFYNQVDHNTAYGSNAGRFNTTGYGLALVGSHIAWNNVNGNNISGIGNGALTSNIDGSDIVVAGTGALLSSVHGNWLTVLGSSAMPSSTGSGSTVVGFQSGFYCTTCAFITTIGFQAGSNITTEENATAIGNGAQVTGSNQVQLGNSSTTTYAYGSVQNRSDARDKYDIRNTTLGLDFINALRPVDFRFDYREDYPDWISDGSKRRPEIHHGLIAQEVKQAMDAQSVEFGGYRDISKEGGKDVKTVGYAELIGPLIKAVQELTQRVEQLER